MRIKKKHDHSTHLNYRRMKWDAVASGEPGVLQFVTHLALRMNLERSLACRKRMKLYAGHVNVLKIPNVRGISL